LKQIRDYAIKQARRAERIQDGYGLTGCRRSLDPGNTVDSVYSIFAGYKVGNTNIPAEYHLKSEYGRWEPGSSSRVYDEVTSLCIDAGNPVDPNIIRRIFVSITLPQNPPNSLVLLLSLSLRTSADFGERWRTERGQAEDKGAQKTPLLGRNRRFKPKNRVFGNEDEGTRTLNLRIDSPSKRFISICQ
jgi:hypothetical protein